MANDPISTNVLKDTYVHTDGASVTFSDLMMNALDPTPDGRLSTYDKAAVASRLREFDTNLDGTLSPKEFESSLDSKIETLFAQKTIADNAALAILGKYGDANGRVEMDVEERMSEADLKAYDAYLEQSVGLTDQLMPYLDLRDAVFESTDDERP